MSLGGLEEKVSAGPDITRLWAKSDPRHPLWKHLLDAASASLAMRNPLAQDGWSAEQLALFVGLHDVGKADPCFQHQVEAFADELEGAGFCKTGDARCRHERLSARYLRGKLKTEGIDDSCASAIARAVVAHHGYWNESDRPVPDSYKNAQDELCQMLEQVLGVTALSEQTPSDTSAFGMRLAGHIVLSDWIASNEEFYDW